MSWPQLAMIASPSLFISFLDNVLIPQALAIFPGLFVSLLSTAVEEFSQNKSSWDGDSRLLSIGPDDD